MHIISRPTPISPVVWPPSRKVLSPYLLSIRLPTPSSRGAATASRQHAKANPFTKLARKLNFSTTARLALRYTPLGPGRGGAHQTFRILHLLPDSAGGLIHCSLQEADLSGREEYEALSYCWGDHSSTTEIVCNNEPLRIPKTLANALHALRHTTRTRSLWADAICIDQTDASEKEKQVLLMREIFSKAQRTLIWLGDLHDTPSQKMSRMAREIIRFGLVLVRICIKRRLSPSVAILDTSTGTSKNLHPFSSAFYFMLIGLLKTPWFRRAWVVQEVVVPSKATVIFGPIQFEWAQLVSALQFMTRANFPLAFMPTFQHALSIEDERVRYEKGTNTLLGLLLRHRRCLATDPRDKVYAFCGLMGVSTGCKVQVPIDYHATVEAVYKDTAIKLLQHNRSLDLLSQYPALEEPDVTHLPSWVPNWSTSDHIPTPHSLDIGTLALAGQEGIGESGHGLYRFAATGASEYIPKFSPSDASLVIRGYEFDTISEIGSIFEGVELPNPATSVRGMIKAWIKSLRSFIQTRKTLLQWEEIASARSGTKYHSGEDMLTAYRQTISAGESIQSKVVRLEVRLWDKMTSLWARSSKRYKLHLNLVILPYCIIVLPYCTLLFLWHAAKNESLLKFAMQGRHTLYRRLIKTRAGYIGVASAPAKPGDAVMLCEGSRVPLILRKTERSNEWRLVGDAYVHGIMAGEKFTQGKCTEMLVR